MNKYINILLFKKKLSDLQEMVKGLNSNDIFLQYDCAKSIRILLSNEKQPPIDEILATGIVPRFMELLNEDNATEDLKFEITWCLVNITSGNNFQTQTVIEHGCFYLKKKNKDR